MSIQVEVDVTLTLRGEAESLAAAGARAVKKGCDVEWAVTGDERAGMVVTVPVQDDLEATFDAIRHITGS